MRASKPSDCKDCGVNTMKIGEYYAVDTELWQLSGMCIGCTLSSQDVLVFGRESICGGAKGTWRCGMLCIGCLEKRIGRLLTPADFDAGAPINRGGRRSERFLDRLGDESKPHRGDAERPG